MSDEQLNMPEPPAVVSLFSGAGGLDLGFKKAGFNLLWANDIDSYATETYRNNIGDHIVCGDIKSIATNDIPECDVLIGGFPCQGFSVANTKRNLNDTRNQLYRQYLRILRAKRPKAFVAENVKGILSMGNGEVIKKIVKEFESAGYSVTYKLLNAADYGVPQTRQRVFIVGVRKDLHGRFQYPIRTHSGKNEPGMKPWVTLEEAFKRIPDPDGPKADEVPNNTYSNYKMVLNGYLGKRPTHSDKPAPTVTARGDRKGGAVVLPHPSGKRRMTVRELATIQDFPIEFKFYGSRTDCYRQVGNAVPVGLAFAIAKSVLRLLTEETRCHHRK